MTAGQHRDIVAPLPLAQFGVIAGQKSPESRAGWASARSCGPTASGLTLRPIAPGATICGGLLFLPLLCRYHTCRCNQPSVIPDMNNTQQTSALNKPRLDNLAGDIWKSAERLRGKFKAYEYQNVILPIIVIRRLECVLIKWREDKAAEVLAKRPNLTEKELAKLVKGLETSTAPFSNKTQWTLRRVYEEDHALLADNFRDYINGFSKNVDDIVEHFNYRATIGMVVKNNRLALMALP